MKISLNGKEYESGKITREKYRKFAEVYEILLGKEKEAQTAPAETAPQEPSPEEKKDSQS